MIRYSEGLLRGARRRAIPLACWALIFILMSSCAARPPAPEEPGEVSFNRRAVALITVPGSEEAENLRRALMRGDRPPRSARIIPVRKMDRLHPSLSRIAHELAECEVSPVIALGEAEAGPGYAVLQRGGGRDGSCEEAAPALSERLEKISDTAGQIFIGLLAVGVTAFLIAAPFLFDLF